MKHLILIFSILLFAVSAVFSQDAEKGVIPLNKADVKPSFNSDYDRLNDYISDHTKYPEKAEEKGIEGTVYISFIIDEDGNVTNAKIANSLHPLLDEQALNAVTDMNGWRPGKKDGENVAVKYVLPVSFKLDNKDDSDKEE